MNVHIVATNAHERQPADRRCTTCSELARSLPLAALGMVWRSQPAGFNPSRVIALWKDPHRGLQQITLADDARVVALTAHRREIDVLAADGRTSSEPVSEFVLSGLEQVG